MLTVFQYTVPSFFPATEHTSVHKAQAITADYIHDCSPHLNQMFVFCIVL